MKLLKKLTKIAFVNWFELQNHTLSFKNDIYLTLDFLKCKIDFSQ